jgi:hypothetical protein
MNTKKGQAALEFMVTYGWAIMSAIIVIGALSYFGVFNTQRYTRDTCYFGDQLVCEDNTALTNGTVKFQIRNNLGADIEVSEVLMKSDYGNTGCNVISPVGVILAGMLFEVDCQPSSNLGNNNKFKYSAIVVFNRDGSPNDHNQTGDVTTTVRSIR